ncbi:hypothetical protein AVEN_49645-1 [Araneus ventricosus]|uniref:Uncharacterized protein n=1 Tax=Araneus ventricosus TaxID=182803 RepID=A0A4Y2H7B4_ARAVE|nr:hypothetical protein AVEN_49645-1 [Araneus ventricosus]
MVQRHAGQEERSTVRHYIKKHPRAKSVWDLFDVMRLGENPPFRPSIGLFETITLSLMIFPTLMTHMPFFLIFENFPSPGKYKAHCVSSSVGIVESV